MGVTKEIINAGNGIDFPKTGDEVTMHYTGKLESGSKYGTTSPSHSKQFVLTTAVHQDSILLLTAISLSSPRSVLERS